MVNITHKSKTLRIAIASARLSVSKQETMEAVLQKKVPKGDVFEFSRAAGLLAVKKTSDVIPDCHPLPVEYTAIRFEIENLSILIKVEVHTIYKTGVEVEAMHGAAITALTMYDMLKPIDKSVTISSIQLEHKSGGKSDFHADDLSQIRCAVIVCSDSISNGQGEDKSGKKLIEKLEGHHLTTQTYKIIPDDLDLIQATVKNLISDHDLILFSGGTGVSKRDITSEAIKPLLDQEIPGIIETMRQYGQQRSPFAMLSRGIAGFCHDTLIITFPGSTRGSEESYNAVFPHVLHALKIKKGGMH